MFKFISVVMILTFFATLSQADEDLLCPEKPHYIVFDEADIKVCDLILDHALLDKPMSAHSVVASFYTEKHFYDKRDDWVASFVFDDGTQKYYGYNQQENKIQAMSSEQFFKKFKSINRCNASPEIPLFKKVIQNLNDPHLF
ncbi:hypothetical protein DM558_01095 [Entomomonas moraniae]|uniref:DUF2511 domain-containing protein n=1 Tax=Entomomonas moraniae TaxID=2213226 RepID=A0A3Q9JLF1_9GAMM|nr:hypothetical protein [Entomomonas moraniae]AZS49456.1 hypothetical protein DM558_01095 [Entomomonas moraniae]